MGFFPLREVICNFILECPNSSQCLSYLAGKNESNYFTTILKTCRKSRKYVYTLVYWYQVSTDMYQVSISIFQMAGALLGAQQMCSKSASTANRDARTSEPKSPATLCRATCATAFTHPIAVSGRNPFHSKPQTNCILYEALQSITKKNTTR